MLFSGATQGSPSVVERSGTLGIRLKMEPEPQRGGTILISFGNLKMEAGGSVHPLPTSDIRSTTHQRGALEFLRLAVEEIGFIRAL